MSRLTTSAQSQPPTAETLCAPRNRRNYLAAVGLLVVLTFLAYLPALRAQFVFDDRQEILENSLLAGWSGLWQIWTSPGATIQYYPLTYTSFWIEQHLWPAAPEGYHVVNILLHGLSVVLVWRVLRRLSVPGAFLAAAIFAVHPVHVESVAWATERKNVLSGAFALASLLSYLRFADIGGPPSSPRGRKGLYLLSIGLFCLALLSKSSVCVLPPVILLLLWWKQRLDRRAVCLLAPMFLLAAGMGLITMHVEQGHFEAATSPSETRLERVLIAGRAVCFYVAKLLWPANLLLIYPRWEEMSRWWNYSYLLVVGSGLFGLWVARRRIGNGPLVAALIFVGALAPVLGMSRIAYMKMSFVADRWQYLPSIALIALISASLTRAVTAAGLSRFHRLLPHAAAALLWLALGVVTWRQCWLYRDPEVLWRATLSQNPKAVIGWSELGKELLRQGRLAESLACHRRAVEAQPASVQAHVNLGIACLQQRQDEEAMRCFTAALELNPANVAARQNLAGALAILGRFSEAVEQFREAIRLAPGDAGLRCNLARLLAAQGDLDGAEKDYREAVCLNPGMLKAQVELAELLGRRGKLAESIEHYRRAADLEPDAAPLRYQLAVALISAGQDEEAARELETVLRIEPSHVRAAQRLQDLRRRQQP